MGIDAGLGGIDKFLGLDRGNAEGPRRGGAIIAASGSSVEVFTFMFPSFVSFFAAACTESGGGPMGFAFSAGSSPGNTQTFNFSS